MKSFVRVHFTLKITDRLVAVVGGGAVGLRKAGVLAAADARVRIVDLKPRPALMDPTWDWVQSEFVPRHLDGADLVVAAASESVNAAVATAARSRGIWLADAIRPERGDITFPAVGRCGKLTLAVDTAGASPTTARRLRDAWLATLEPEFPAWLDLLLDIRRDVRAALGDTAQRQALTAEFAGEPWRRMFAVEGEAAVRAAMTTRLHEVQSRPK